jgi:hypothetical protein
MLQKHVLEDIQALLTFALITSTNIRMCTRQHTLGHEMKLRVEKNVNTQPCMFCCAILGLDAMITIDKFHLLIMT